MQSSECGVRNAGPAEADSQDWVTRSGLASLLGVSLRTVDRMLAAKEVIPVRMRGWSVRFYVPDVVECLRNKNRKWGRAAALPGTSKEAA